jgi:hypothetical protein
VGRRFGGLERGLLTGIERSAMVQLRLAAGETLDVGDGVVVEGLQDLVMLVDGWSGLGNGRWKTAPVAARGEEEGGVGRPWQLRAGVSLAHGWDSGRWRLGHSTWLHIGDDLLVHNGGRAGMEWCGMRKGKGGNSPQPRTRFIGSGNPGATAMATVLPRCTWGGGVKPWGGNTAAGTIVRRRPLTGGLHRFNLFPNFLNRVKLVNSILMPYPTPKILKFCMKLDWSILNNSLNCADFKFPTEVMLKIMEQIQYLNLL